MPRWRGDGKEIVYLSLDGKLMAARISSDGTSFQSSTPKLLSVLCLPSCGAHVLNMMLRRTASTFLMIEPAEKPEYLPLALVNNWRTN
jgi:hypothetical protein